MKDGASTGVWLLMQWSSVSDGDAGRLTSSVGRERHHKTDRQRRQSRVRLVTGNRRSQSVARMHVIATLRRVALVKSATKTDNNNRFVWTVCMVLSLVWIVTMIRQFFNCLVDSRHIYPSHRWSSTARSDRIFSAVRQLNTSKLRSTTSCNLVLTIFLNILFFDKVRP